MRSELFVVNENLVFTATERSNDVCKIIVSQVWIDHLDDVVQFKLCNKPVPLLVDFPDSQKDIFYFVFYADYLNPFLVCKCPHVFLLAMKDASIATSINSFFFLVWLTNINFTIHSLLHDVKLLVIDWVDVDSDLSPFIPTGERVKKVLAFRATELNSIQFENPKEALEINLVLIILQRCIL